MRNSELPTWLLTLLGLSAYTPRGMAVRFAKSTKLAMVQRPIITEAQLLQASEGAPIDLTTSVEQHTAEGSATPVEDAATPDRRAA